MDAADVRLMTYHEPVLREVVAQALVWDPDGVYVDGTFGGGGHSRAVLEVLSPKGQLVGLDQDPEAPLEALMDPRFVGVRANFRDLTAVWAQLQLPALAGVLLDLGVSSHQLDTPERGFSYRWAGPLDLRMNPRAGLPAHAWLEAVSVETLATCLREYGDLPRSRALAARLQAARPETTQDLRAVVEAFYGKQKGKDLVARVFQALRIAVNDELGALAEALAACTSVVVTGGRLVALTYHSGEARLVKRLFQQPQQEDPLYGQRVYGWRLIQKDRPSPEEIARNPRSRSARLWMLEKLGNL